MRMARARRGAANAPATGGGKLKLQRDPLRIVVALLIVIAISRVHQHFGPIAALRPAMLLVVLAGAYAYLNPRFVADGNLLRSVPARAMAGLGIMACLSVPLAISLGNSGQFIIQEYSKTLLLGFLIVAAIRNARDLYTLTWAFVAAIGILAFLSLFVFRMAAAGTMMRIAGGYTYDANDIGAVVVVGLGITLLLLQTVRGPVKLVALGVLVASGAALAKTGSRGAFVGLLVLGAAMLFLLRDIRLDKKLAFIVVVAIGISVAAPQGYWTQMRTILAPTQDYNWTAPAGRKAVMQRGIGYMMQNPITGIGVDNFPRAEGLISDRARDYIAGTAGIKWSAAHNSFLQVAAEMGIPGFVLFCVLIFGSAASLWQHRRRLPRAWLHAGGEERFLYLATMYLPVALIGFAAAGFFVSFAYSDLIYILVGLAGGTITCVRTKLTAPTSAGAQVGRPLAASHARSGRRAISARPHRM